MVHIGGNPGAGRGPDGPGIQGWSDVALQQAAVDYGEAEDMEHARTMSRSWLLEVVEQHMMQEGELNRDGTWNEDHEFGDF